MSNIDVERVADVKDDNVDEQKRQSTADVRINDSVGEKSKRVIKVGKTQHKTTAVSFFQLFR